MRFLRLYYSTVQLLRYINILFLNVEVLYCHYYSLIGIFFAALFNHFQPIVPRVAWFVMTTKNFFLTEIQLVSTHTYSSILVWEKNRIFTKITNDCRYLCASFSLESRQKWGELKSKLSGDIRILPHCCLMTRHDVTIYDVSSIFFASDSKLQLQAILNSVVLDILSNLIAHLLFFSL